MCKKINLDKEELYNLYITQEFSTKKIAKILSVSQNVVVRNLNVYGIQIRDKKEAQKQAMKKYGEEIRANNLECNLNCAECGKPIYVKKGLLHTSKKHFCSSKCSALYYGRNKTKTGKYSTCDFCGEIMYKINYLVNNFKHHFCSKDCHHEWMKTDENKGENNSRYNRVKVNCANCNKELNVVPSAYKSQKNHYCSKECMAEHYVGLVYGENHPSWKGGYNDVYYGPNWKYVREAARKRDKHTCQRCGMTEKELGHALPVHHITPIRKYKNWLFANRLSNLISLCPKCHGTVEYSGIDFDIKHRIVQTTTLKKWPGKPRSGKKH